MTRVPQEDAGKSPGTVGCPQLLFWGLAKGPEAEGWSSHLLVFPLHPLPGPPAPLSSGGWSPLPRDQSHPLDATLTAKSSAGTRYPHSAASPGLPWVLQPPRPPLGLQSEPTFLMPVPRTGLMPGTPFPPFLAQQNHLCLEHS